MGSSWAKYPQIYITHTLPPGRTRRSPASASPWSPMWSAPGSCGARWFICCRWSPCTPAESLGSLCNVVAICRWTMPMRPVVVCWVCSRESSRVGSSRLPRCRCVSLSYLTHTRTMPRGPSLVFCYSSMPDKPTQSCCSCPSLWISRSLLFLLRNSVLCWPAVSCCSTGGSS